MEAGTQKNITGAQNGARGARAPKAVIQTNDTALWPPAGGSKREREESHCQQDQKDLKNSNSKRINLFSGRSSSHCCGK